MAHQRLALRLTVDDVDPYRDCFALRPAARLSEAEAAAWTATLGDAWRLLATYAPEHAAELAAGLRIFVPLADDGSNRHSVTHADGFGAFAASVNLAPVDLAVTMLHEFQHSKLSGLLNMTHLYDTADPVRYFAPWRTDPRPINGLMQGVYAFAAVGEIWAALRAHPRWHERATRRFASVRFQVDRAVSELRRALSLTPTGQLWVDRLAQRSAALMAVPVQAEVHEAARTALLRSEQGWLAGRR